MTRKLIALVGVAVFISIFAVLPALAGPAAKPKTVEAFTDPDKVFPMPEDWKARRIQYADWAKGADVAVSLEQDVYQIVLPLIRKFSEERKLRVAVKEGTCGIAAGMLSEKSVDMGGFCCPPSEEDRLPGLAFHTLGITSKAFFVHPENPVKNITSEQLLAIYKNKLQNWSEVAPPGSMRKGSAVQDLKVRAVARLHCARRPGHWRLMIDSGKEFGPRVKEVSSIPDMISEVAASKAAIGWEALSMVEKYRDLGRVKVLSIDGHSPTDPEALARGDYRFYRTYNLTTWTPPGLSNNNAALLVKYLTEELEKVDPRRFGFASAKRLRQKGWLFKGDELVGEPLKKGKGAR